MTQWNDQLRSGAAPPPPTGLSGGVPMARDPFYTSVPLTAVTNSLAVKATLSGSAVAFTLQAGTGLTTEIINGVTYYKFDVERCVLATGGDSTTAGVLVTVVGLDEYKQPLTSSFSGPTGSGAGTVSPKAFRWISGATASGNTLTGGLLLGQSDTLGLAFLAPSFEEVNIAFAGARITASTGFSVGDATDPATAFTGDVRGRYALQTASNGARRFSIQQFVRDPDTAVGVRGVTQV